MDGSSFDRIIRRLAVTTSRRTGIAVIVSGAIGIVGISSAEAMLELPPRCRNAGSPCHTGDVCCSGRCIAKADGSMRCARTTSNRKKKNRNDGGDTPLPQCVAEGGACDIDDDCCGSRECSNGVCAAVCKFAGQRCATVDDCCQDGLTLSCTANRCCVAQGGYCTATSECCGLPCVANTCTP